MIRLQTKSYNCFKNMNQQLTIKCAIPENQLSEEAKKEQNKNKKLEKMVNRGNEIQKTIKFVYNLQEFQPQEPLLFWG